MSNSAIDSQLIDLYTGGVNLPVPGQHGFIAKAVASGDVFNLDYFDPASAEASGLSPALQQAGLWVPSIWGGSPVGPTIRYNQSTLLAANTLAPLDVPKVISGGNRQAWVTADFEISSTSFAKFTYNGLSGVFVAIAWSLQFQVVTNPTRVCYFGIQVDAETVPRAEHMVNVSGAAGTRFNALGRTVIQATDGMQFSLACNPYNGTLPANSIGYEEVSMSVATLGAGTLET